MKLISQLTEKEQAQWHETMLGFAYDMQDWENARQTLIELLIQTNRRAQESAIRTYISCCAEAVATTMPLANLSSTVEDFFKRYGMDDSQT